MKILKTIPPFTMPIATFVASGEAFVLGGCFFMENKKEIWRDIIGYEGLYQISNLGNVKSLPKTVICGYYKGVPYYSNRVAIILKPSKNSFGYMYVVFYKNNSHKNHQIHRLVAENFILNPKLKKTVNHIDGSKENNNVLNLEWNTYSENHRHAYDVLGRKSSKFGKKGKECYDSKTVIQLTEHDFVVRVWDSISDAQRSGYRQSSISQCCNGKLKKHKGYKWKFA